MRPIYILRIQPERTGTAGDRDIREVLKRLLRSFGIQCLSIQTEPQTAQDTAGTLHGNVDGKFSGGSSL